MSETTEDRRKRIMREAAYVCGVETSAQEGYAAIAGYLSYRLAVLEEQLGVADIFDCDLRRHRPQRSNAMLDSYCPFFGNDQFNRG